MHLEDQNKYIYHLSDHLTHNFAFTFCVINHFIGLHDETPLIRFKSDNCSTQYKCKHVFGKCKDLAVKIGFPIIWYYGVSGHGKGLVDAISGFGVKGPLRKAVVTEDFHYDHANDILNYLNSFFSQDSTKKHYELTSDEIYSVPGSAIQIKDVRKQHIILFFPDGNILVKLNICSCNKCLQGDLIKCEFEPGKQINSNYLESKSDVESDNNEDEDYEVEQREQQKLRGDCILEMIECNSYIAIFSHQPRQNCFNL